MRPVRHVHKPGLGLAQVLRRRRGLRRGVATILFCVAGAALGALVPRIGIGPTVSGGDVTVLAAALAAAMITFIGLVYSLLFMVLQFSATTWTPRLNFFRENPVVWRSFGYFVGVFIWGVTTALAVGLDEDVTLLSPLTGVVLVLGALACFRALQNAAAGSLQLATILRSIVVRGREVIEALYAEPYHPHPHDDEPLPEVRIDVRWPGPSGVLRRIDLPAVIAVAKSAGGIVELTVQPGDSIREGRTVARLRGGTGEVDRRSLFDAFEVGLERTMEQDPRFGFQLLVDIALRALSPALNDQTTALEAIEAIDCLLTPIALRDLDIGRTCDDDRHLRVMVRVPSWEEYLELALGDVARAGGHHVAVVARLTQLVDDLIAVAPPARHAALVVWRDQLSFIRGAQVAEQLVPACSPSGP